MQEPAYKYTKTRKHNVLFFCNLFSALYWQSFSPRRQRKNHLKGPDPFSQCRKKGWIWSLKAKKINNWHKHHFSDCSYRFRWQMLTSLQGPLACLFLPGFTRMILQTKEEKISQTEFWDFFFSYNPSRNALLSRTESGCSSIENLSSKRDTGSNVSPCGTRTAGASTNAPYC